MAKLTAEQQRALEFVAKVDSNWRDAKRNAMIQARKLVQENIDMHAAQRDEAVWEAVQAGVPKARITQDALHTSPNAIYEILDRISQKLELVNVDLAQKPVEQYSWTGSQKLPNGVVIWFLAVDGDEHTVDMQLGEGESWHLRGDGYPYTHELTGRWSWPMDKPSDAAVMWALENRPE